MRREKESDRFQKAVVPRAWRTVKSCSTGLCRLCGGWWWWAWAGEFWHVGVFLALSSPSYGGLASLMPALRGDYFGRRAFATIGGSMGPVTTLGTVSGPVFAGYIFDSTGSYRNAMLVFAVGMVIALLVTSFLQRPQLPTGATRTVAVPESL